MFSLKETFAKLDKQEHRFQAALGCYLAAIAGIREQIVEVAPELTREYRLILRALLSELSESPDIKSLTESRTKLTRELAAYRAKATAFLSAKEADLRAMLGSLAEAAGTLSGYNDQHSLRLKTFTQHLQIVAGGSDFTRMRRDLAQAVVELKSAREEINRDNDSLVAGMHRQLAELQKRMERTEERAFTDSLTGLLNRGEGEARLAARLNNGENAVSVILIDLDDFKQVNDNFGHVSGDQVLRTVAHILVNGLRACDTVCRWGGDEFLVVVSGDQATAEQGALRLREALKVRCKLVILRKLYDIGIGASVGVAQARAGETVDDLVARADIDLYRQKKGRFTVPDQESTAGETSSEVSDNDMAAPRLTPD